MECGGSEKWWNATSGRGQGRATCDEMQKENDKTM